jgi:SLT domain-containing protein
MVAIAQMPPHEWAKELGFPDLEAKYALPEGLLEAVCFAESNGNPNAVSTVGAQGLFQLMPATAKDLGVNDPFNPNQAAPAAAGYFATHFKNHDGDVAKALACYNWGMGNVAKAVAKYGDNWQAHAPKETKDYIAKITDRMGIEAPRENYVELRNGDHGYVERQAQIAAEQQQNQAPTKEPEGFWASLMAFISSLFGPSEPTQSPADERNNQQYAGNKGNTQNQLSAQQAAQDISLAGTGCKYHTDQSSEACAPNTPGSNQSQTNIRGAF